MELNFRENPHLFSNMIDAIADGVFSVDAKGTLLRGVPGPHGLLDIPVLMSGGNPAMTWRDRIDEYSQSPSDHLNNNIDN